MRLGIASFGLLLGIVGLTGCADPMDETEWESRERLSNGERNELYLDADGFGELKMFVQLDAQSGLSELDYEVEWFTTDFSDVYDLELSCDKGCPPDRDVDFDMECVYFPEYLHLDCDGEAPFKGYGFFEFEPVE